jgi:hypothetical protein
MNQFRRDFNRAETQDSQLNNRLSQQAEREMRNQKNPIEQGTDTMRDLNQLGGQINRGLSTIDRTMKSIDRIFK